MSVETRLRLDSIGVMDVLSIHFDFPALHRLATTCKTLQTNLATSEYVKARRQHLQPIIDLLAFQRQDLDAQGWTAGRRHDIRMARAFTDQEFRRCLATEPELSAFVLGNRYGHAPFKYRLLHFLMLTLGDYNISHLCMKLDAVRFVAVRCRFVAVITRDLQRQTELMDQRTYTDMLHAGLIRYRKRSSEYYALYTQMMEQAARTVDCIATRQTVFTDLLVKVCSDFARSDLFPATIDKVRMLKATGAKTSERINRVVTDERDRLTAMDDEDDSDDEIDFEIKEYHKSIRSRAAVLIALLNE